MRTDVAAHVAVVAGLCLGAAGCAGLAPCRSAGHDTLFQVSTIDALMAGVYEGSLTCGELLRAGDLGIGTFDGLDGEMVVLDGAVYRVAIDGTVSRMAAAETTPFAAVTPFEADRVIELQDMDFAGLQARLLSEMPSPNLVYAIRVDGQFASVKTRSVPRQSRPYRPLAGVVKEEAVSFDLADVEGTLVGFWCPVFVKGVNVPGYHLHFLTADRRAGGHVLDLNMTRGRAALDVTTSVMVELPDEGDFLAADLAGDTSAALHAVEKGGGPQAADAMAGTPAGK